MAEAATAVAAVEDGATGGGEGAPAESAASPAAPWYRGFDGETQAYLRNKGWINDSGPAEVVKAYRHLERMQRSEHVPWPKDDKDAEGYARIYDRLGRPKDPSGYGLQAPAGGDRAFADAMARTFHDLGLSARQAQGIAQRYGAHASAMQAEADRRFANRSAAELGQVRRDWGEAADRRFAAAQRFAVAFGLDRPVMEKIERAIGTRGMLTLFARIGEGLSEDRGHGAGGISGFMGTEAAQARLNELKADQSWVKRYLNGGQSERAEYEKLIAIVAGA
jgi:hypothetical protein